MKKFFGVSEMLSISEHNNINVKKVFFELINIWHNITVLYTDYFTGSYNASPATQPPPLGYIVAYTPEQIAELVKDQYHAPAALRTSVYGSPTHVPSIRPPMSPLITQGSPKHRPFSVCSQLPSHNQVDVGVVFVVEKWRERRDGVGGSKGRERERGVIEK